MHYFLILRFEWLTLLFSLTIFFECLNLAASHHLLIWLTWINSVRGNIFCAWINGRFPLSIPSKVWIAHPHLSIASRARAQRCSMCRFNSLAFCGLRENERITVGVQCWTPRLFTRLWGRHASIRFHLRTTAHHCSRLSGLLYAGFSAWIAGSMSLYESTFRVICIFLSVSTRNLCLRFNSLWSRVSHARRFARAS